MSGLTDEERELKRLAEKAAAKPFNGRESMYVHGLFESRANPATVLRLLARIEELEERLRNDDYRVGLQRWCERPVVDATGKHGGPCSLEIGHEDGCAHWVNGRHPPMTTK